MYFYSCKFFLAVKFIKIKNNTTSNTFCLKFYTNMLQLIMIKLIVSPEISYSGLIQTGAFLSRKGIQLKTYAATGTPVRKLSLKIMWH